MEECEISRKNTTVRNVAVLGNASALIRPRFDDFVKMIVFTTGLQEYIPCSRVKSYLLLRQRILDVIRVFAFWVCIH